MFDQIFLWRKVVREKAWGKDIMGKIFLFVCYVLFRYAIIRLVMVYKSTNMRPYAFFIQF